MESLHFNVCAGAVLYICDDKKSLDWIEMLTLQLYMSLLYEYITNFSVYFDFISIHEALL